MSFYNVHKPKLPVCFLTQPNLYATQSVHHFFQQVNHPVIFAVLCILQFGAAAFTEPKTGDRTQLVEC